jgi:ABC-2 type transport system permease protein
MRKVWIVAQREYLYNLRRRAFLFAAFGVPLFTIGLMIVIFAIAFDSETDTNRVGTVGYVDAAGVLSEARDKPENFTAYSTEDEARADLEGQTIGAYFVLPPDYLQSGALKLYSLSGVPDALKDDINGFLVANLGAEIADSTTLERIQNPVEMTVRALDTGRSLKGGAIAGLFLSPLLFVFVMLFSTQIASGYLMSGVVEEKTNRIMEILITSVTPFEMLMGKIIGLGALGLTQLTAWLLMGFVALRLGQATDFLAGVQIPPDMLAFGVIYFLLSYLLFSSVMAGIGAVVGSEQESRQFAGLLSFTMSIPFFFIVSFITDPNGTIPLILTLVPLTAPITVILRMGFSVIPAWQLALSIAILLATTLLVVWASARVFRWSLLMYGKRPGLREILRAVRRAPRMGTAASGESAS